MIFPLGEYFIFVLGVYTLWLERARFSRRFWGGLWIAWFTGFLLEGLFPWKGAYHWHFSRVLVMIFFAGVALKNTNGRKFLPALVTAFALVAQNLFAVNEPGIVKGDQWFFGAIVVFVALITSRDFWGMGLALIGGILLDLGISVFLFQGIVRHYDLPDPFFWNLSVIFLSTVACARTLRKKRNDVLIEMSEKE
ncbi:hypothetical protein [Desulfitobacterium metallireducens]|uniref:Membrane protein n=1 Tax=Desulfitobacterium metallireducens DSM 15288 TaxID=871968 RepID=W0EDZ0_9FIRM|nr:hypothetical protein [Desulfitobacterium metallireducens]AHF07281.1 membrane protein [Desulfitobacterium metallireducens DSM 15288]